jgi:hypothetical protein
MRESMMFLVTLEASPKPSHAEYGEVDGAFANCWVNEATAGLAEAVAREGIEGHGWDVVELDEVREITREEYRDDPEALEFFDQAMLDGLVIVFYRWAVGADDEPDDPQ